MIETNNKIRVINDVCEDYPELDVVDRFSFKDYFELYKPGLFESNIHEKLIELKDWLVKTNRINKKTIIFGNGGSSAVASHVALDLSKSARIRAVSFNEADLITCFANDFGYENWMAKAVEMFGDEGDLAVLISSSGESQNVINAATTAKAMEIKVVTFTGFNADNRLKREGQLNFWLNSRAYNIVEMVHQIWLLAICDAIIGTSEYSPS